MKNWLFCHEMRLFFSDFPAWGKLTGNTAAGFSQEYTDLFQGTNADIYVPLWASCCMEKYPVLMNETTLAVLTFCHAWGYEPQRIDGNPPDYIGEMFSFLAYLHACKLHAQSAGDPAGTIENAIADFVARFVRPTAEALCGALRKETATPLFLAIADRLLAYLSGEESTACPADIAQSPDADAHASGPRPPIENAPEHIVKTAGMNNCGGKCPIQARVQEDCVLEMLSECTQIDEARPCVRGYGYRWTFLQPDRLRYPMRRVGERGEGKFERISWDEATTEIAENWRRIRDAYGPASRFILYSTGVSALMRPSSFAERLLNIDGGYLGYYNTYSDACAEYITPYIYGDTLSGNSPEDLLNANLIILWGHNPTETIFGAGRNRLLADCKARGTKIIVIDPRESDSALAFADEWIGLRPSTDGALADAMAYVIVSENLHDQAFLDKFCLGFDEAHMPEGIPANESYEAYLFGRQDGIPKTPAWAEAICGVPAEAIIHLARAYASAKPGCILPGYGPQRTGNGEQTTRGIALLCALTGNIGVPGGSAAGVGFIRKHRNPAFPTLQNPVKTRIPNFLWTRAVDDPFSLTAAEDGLRNAERLDAPVKMLVNLAGNTLINQHSDINRTISILRDTTKCEFILCSDIFMTPSARFADILLPAPSMFENENITQPWSYGNYLLYLNRATRPLFGARFEYAWLREVAQKLGHLEAFENGHADVQDWMRDIYATLRESEPELPDYKAFQLEGGFQYKHNTTYIAYREQIQNDMPFSTPSGKIELFSRRLYDLGDPAHKPGLPKYTPCIEGFEDPLREKFPLQLIGWHTKRRCHSIHDNNPLLEEVDRPSLWMHPEDAATRGIAEGAEVLVYNDRGRVRIPVHVTRRIVRGVVAMSQGGWYTPDKQGVDRRGSINVLTSHQPTPIAKGNPQHTNLVEVALP